MIPQKLELTNFLSFRETAVLDFSGIHLACISGPNGAGKSSILDAITWALFGRSRSRSDDDLINRLAAINDHAAAVCFTFLLEGTSYRILRRKRPGKAMLLELQIAAGEDGWKTLSERRLRETQAAIEQLLRMNYDTFTNASFLLQGKADQFTTRTPNQRKEILAELLGVTDWERYREAAAEARKVEQGKLSMLEGRLEDIQSELAQEPERKSALHEAQNQRLFFVEKLKLQEQLLNQMRQTAAAVEQQKILVKNLSGTVDRIQRNLTASRNTATERRQEKETNDVILADTASITADYAAWQSADAALQSWQEKANSYNQLLQQKNPAEMEVAQERSRLGQQQKQLEERAQQVRKAQNEHPKLQETVRKGEAHLAELSSMLTELDRTQQHLHSAQGDLQQTIGERRQWQQELTRLQTQDERLQKLTAEKTAVHANSQEAVKLLSYIDEQLENISEQQNSYIDSKAELDTLRSQQAPLRKQMDTLKGRIDRLQEAKLDSECPTCGQPLSAQHRQAVLGDLQREGKELADRYRANGSRIALLEVQVQQLQEALQQKPRLERDRKIQQERLAQAEARLAEVGQIEEEWNRDGAHRLVELTAALADETNLKTQQTRVAELEAQLQPRAALQTEKQDLLNEISTAKARANEMDRQIDAWQTEGQAQLKEIRRQLTAEEYALDARKTLKSKQAEIDAVGYDASAHQTARIDRDALSAAPPRYQALRQAEAAAQPLEKTLSELQQRIQQQENDLAQEEEQYETAVSQLESLVAGTGDLQTTEDEVFRLREDEIAAARLVGAAQQRFDVLQDLRLQKSELAQEKSILSSRIQQLKLLEKSCGPGGVQALLIEHALPEIEERANQLLDHLTGGDMRIIFDTQRKLKTRDAMSETLDIRIADKDGERPYDNYSGGEQFRVNFAIRLALSQLLARRAGARLQTLVVDEGFGSQDPQGRQRLVEAINAVRDQFACILVITHIEELRDAFSTRIEVRKGRAGSTIKVD